MNNTLILGYGNLDRQDDGVAWHILAKIALASGRKVPSDIDGFEPSGQNPDLMFCLQLTPELAETLSVYDRVCFVDAHTGSVPEDLHMEHIQPTYQSSPFTHHMTAHTCLAFCETLYHARPEAILVSVRGYYFGFDRTLSPDTEELAAQAAGYILNWISEETTI
jgi:hydrogenase maturation protease